MITSNGKYIRVYGTLVNHTVDSDLSDSIHNDMLSYAKQLYDDQFYAGQKTINNYQDIINKRVTAISFTDDGEGGGVTTIENRNSDPGDPYMLVVNGNTNIGGNLNVEGDTTVKNLTITGDISGIKLGDLDDVDTTGEQAGQYLKCINNNGTLEWVPTVIALNDIQGLADGNDGDVLTYVQGQGWLPRPVTIEHLNDIGDVNAASPTDGAILIWDNNAKKWKPSTTTIQEIVAGLLWELVPNDNTKIQAKTYSGSNKRAAIAGGFYDSTVS